MVGRYVEGGGPSMYAPAMHLYITHALYFFFIFFIFLMKILQECKDIQIAKANKKYTQVKQQQKPT